MKIAKLDEKAHNIVVPLLAIVSFYFLSLKAKYPDFIFEFKNITYFNQLFFLLVTYLVVKNIDKLILLNVESKIITALKKIFVWLVIYSLLDFLLKLDSSRVLILTSILFVSVLDIIRSQSIKKGILIILIILNIFIYKDKIIAFIPKNPDNQTIIANKCKEENSGTAIYSICTKIPDLKLSNDLEATSIIRSYFHENIFIQSGIQDVQVKQRPTNIIDWIDEYDVKNSGSMCGDLAAALRDIYNDFGLEAETFNFGHEPSTATHVVTLVKIAGDFYLQDPLFNYDIKDKKSQQQIPIHVALKQIENLQLDDIYGATLKSVSYRRILEASNISEADLVKFDCNDLNNDLVLCDKYTPSRKLSDLDRDARYVNALSKANAILGERENSLKYLYLMRFPIGNNPEVICAVLDNC